MATAANRPSYEKLPTLPKNAKVTKRRLTRPPIPARNSSQTPIVYVSSKTPFMSAITRLRKHIKGIQKRRSQSIHAVSSNKQRKGPGRGGDHILAAAVESLGRHDRVQQGNGKTGDEVVITGTGKAIEKVVGIAGWLGDNAAKEGVRVRMETGSHYAVDDVEVVEDEEGAEGMEVDGREEEDGEEDIPDSRLRRVSILELRVTVL